MVETGTSWVGFSAVEGASAAEAEPELCREMLDSAMAAADRGEKMLVFGGAAELLCSALTRAAGAALGVVAETVAVDMLDRYKTQGNDGMEG